MCSQLLLTLALVVPAQAPAIAARAVAVDLTRVEVDATFWDAIAAAELQLTAQPMVTPRPAATTTTSVSIQAAHDGKRIAFRLRWQDDGADEAGKLDQFSDAVALQFPVKSNTSPPLVFMGAAGDPVHIFHWRAQYQRDAERGKPTMRDLYPNMSVDMYPMEFADPGSAGKASAAQRETFSPGVAEGNPQSFPKRGVDEILAEGFSTSSVQPDNHSTAKGAWRDGLWTVVIVRELVREGGSSLVVGQGTFIAAAVWQGGKREVGSRKSVTMAWTPLLIEAQKEARR